LGRELLQSLAGTDVVPRLISDTEWRLGPLTLLVERDRARLRYAREPVATTGASAGEIAAAWRKAVARLEARSSPPDQFLPKLVAAYGKVLARRNAAPPVRVPLVEVRTALAGFTRAQFAWDVARLQSERRLSMDGRRIDLGVATGHAAARKSRVVWLEDASGSGAYYETFRLMEVA
jgi:hypothetical protein